MTEPINPTLVPVLSTPYPDASDQDTFDARAAALFLYLVNTLTPGANVLAAQAYNNALAALDAANAAYINANFKGSWASLTGALAMPALVSHADKRWVLLVDLPNVTASVPGSANPDWELFELPKASGVGFDPSGTSRSATDVQTVLTQVSNDTDTALVDFENPILNGDMRVAQSGTSFSCPPGLTRAIDGFMCTIGGTAVLTLSQSAAATPDNANARWLIATVATADASIAASEFVFLSQRIEGHEVARYVNKTFTLGCWVRSSVTGVHCIVLRNGVNDRSFVGEVNIAVANTPQFATLTVPGGIPSSGTWDFTTGTGLELDFTLASGTNFHGATGSWLSANKIASTAQVNAIGTPGNVFGITDVQINPGSVAKRFKRPTLAESLARCQRYYEVVPFAMLKNSLNGGLGSVGAMGFYKTEKAKAPTISAAAVGLSGGDTFVKPGFPGDGLWAAGDNEKSGFYQITPGTFTPSSGNPRDFILLKVTADARL